MAIHECLANHHRAKLRSPIYKIYNFAPVIASFARQLPLFSIFLYIFDYKYGSACVNMIYDI